MEPTDAMTSAMPMPWVGGWRVKSLKLTGFSSVSGRLSVLGVKNRLSMGGPLDAVMSPIRGACDLTLNSKNQP